MWRELHTVLGEASNKGQILMIHVEFHGFFMLLGMERFVVMFE